MNRKNSSIALRKAKCFALIVKESGKQIESIDFFIVID